MVSAVTLSSAWMTAAGLRSGTGGGGGGGGGGFGGAGLAGALLLGPLSFFLLVVWLVAGGGVISGGGGVGGPRGGPSDEDGEEEEDGDDPVSPPVWLSPEGCASPARPTADAMTTPRPSARYARRITPASRPRSRRWPPDARRRGRSSLWAARPRWCR